MSVTSRQLMTELGIKNVKTLTRWYQEQVIPPPEVKRHPGGAGRIACWPEWVLKHGHTVKNLLSEGQTLNDIAATFGTNWAAIEARYRRYNFARVSAEMDRQNYLRDVGDAIDKTVIQHLGQIRKRLEATILPPVTLDIVGQAADLLENGQNPVLILSSREILAVPDFLLSLYLSKHFEDSLPFLVVPLFAIATQLKPKKKSEQIKPPTIQPVSGIVTRGEKGDKKRAVVLGDRWDFQIQGRSRKADQGKPRSQTPD